MAISTPRSLTSALRAGAAVAEENMVELLWGELHGLRSGVSPKMARLTLTHSIHDCRNFRVLHQKVRTKMPEHTRKVQKHQSTLAQIDATRRPDGTTSTTCDACDEQEQFELFGSKTSTRLAITCLST